MWAAAAAMAAGAADAAPASWTCWLHRGQQLACLSTAEADGAAANAAHAGQRELMHLIRMRPGALRGQIVYIPLYTVPFEDSPLAALADAVLCGPRARDVCTVTMERDATRLNALARQAFSDANDPVLNRP